jgi:ribonuclease R
LLIAIADVAHYVPPGSALDREAYRRGNSAYFPDRVVPMLPEELSNDLCSLRPEEDRACLAVHIWIDGRGAKRHHRFERGLMRSAARLTYDQMQRARDGRADRAVIPLLDRVVSPLYGAYEALAAERRRRGTLDLDLPERRVVLAEDGSVARIEPRARFDSHRLIEEFMIAANVAAAETLEQRRQPCMYRVHDAPDPAKAEALREFLETIDLPLARGQALRPKMFTDLLVRAARTPFAEMVNELVLRSQAQALYSPRNIGHFGLALTRYAHFTSPIRRYADLLVHRALISGLGLGAAGLDSGAEERFEEAGAHISATERRAAQAERDAVDRYTAAYLSARVGDIFTGRVSGVTRFGLFVTLFETGADGLVPIGTLGSDYYEHDEKRHALVGRRSGETFRLGERIAVRLIEAEPATGGVLLEVVHGEDRPQGEPRPAWAAWRGRRRESSAPSKTKDGTVAKRGKAAKPKKAALRKRGETEPRKRAKLPAPRGPGGGRSKSGRRGRR